MKQPELGKMIVQLRKSRGFTQEELVEKCNLSVRTLQRIESGEVTPRNYTLKLIFSALEYDLHYQEQILKSDTTAGFRLKEWSGKLLAFTADLFNLRTNTMRKLMILSLPLIAVGLLLVLSSRKSEAQNITEVKEIIEQKNRKMTEWFNSGQIDSVLTIYRNDACLIAIGCGKNAIREYYTIQSDRFRFQSINTISVSVSDTIAVEKGNWVIRFYSGDVIHGEYLSEWRYSKGVWLMVNDIGSPMQ